MFILKRGDKNKLTAAQHGGPEQDERAVNWAVTTPPLQRHVVSAVQTSFRLKVLRNTVKSVNFPLTGPVKHTFSTLST